MKWILVIVLLSPGDNSRMKQIEFQAQAECAAAARQFVEQNPGVELRESSNAQKVEESVLRSYVQCVPQAGNEQ
jgi:hypothetical protein